MKWGRRLCWHGSWRGVDWRLCEARAWFHWDQKWGRNVGEESERRRPNLARIECFVRRCGLMHAVDVCERMREPVGAVVVKDRVEGDHWWARRGDPRRFAGLRRSLDYLCSTCCGVVPMGSDWNEENVSTCQGRFPPLAICGYITYV